MITFLYILLAIAVLLVMITVHELGHYTAGKLLKFQINEFSIGFGKAIFSKTKKSGEKFSLRIFPLGGYCAFEGEDKDIDNPKAFNNQKPWKRLIVLFAGVFFNFLFGLLASVIFLAVVGNSLPKITYLAPSNPNAIVLKEGDVITAVNGKSIEYYRSMTSLTEKIKGKKEFELTIKRDGKSMDVTVARYDHGEYHYVGDDSKVSTFFIKDSSDNLIRVTSSRQICDILDAHPEDYSEYFFYENGAVVNKDIFDKTLSITKAGEDTNLGIVMTYVKDSYSFLECLWKVFPFAGYICWMILSALGGLFTGATAVGELGGTVTAISQVAEVSRMGIEMFLYLIPVLSFNLALFNFLPIPALDGARFVFVLIEWIFRKPVPRKIEAWIHAVGLIVLLGLVLFLDIYHFFIA